MKTLHTICSLSLFCYGTIYSDQSTDLNALLNEQSHETIMYVKNTSALHKLYNILDNNTHWELYGTVEECRKMSQTLTSINERINQPDQKDEIAQMLNDHKYTLEKKYSNFYAYTVRTFKDVIRDHIQNNNSKEIIETCLGALQSIIKSTQKNSECVTQ